VRGEKIVGTFSTPVARNSASYFRTMAYLVASSASRAPTIVLWKSRSMME
jgi:hypothetical protein